LIRGSPEDHSPAVGRTGVLLLNVGTPDSTETGDVRRYLKEFLSDPHVIDMHPVARWLLLHLFILRTRPSRSAEAYKKIWLPEGSPILVHGHAFGEALQERLGSDYEVVLAMRYGRPSIAEGIARLRAGGGISKLVAFPLFPHLASATTGTAIEAVSAELEAASWAPRLDTVPPFFADTGYVRALAGSALPTLAQICPDHLLFSFHGLPESHVRRADPSAEHCLESPDCCASVNPRSQHCYRAQCFETARLTAAELRLKEGGWSVAFQSRLGRTPWIGPHTSQAIPTLIARGGRRLAVLCPSFVADCLETLEEIGIRERESFKAHGGDELTLIPSLNAGPTWVGAAAELVRRLA
jgi:protoporphyrin/coproporphyrin ferrochelatase